MHAACDPSPTADAIGTACPTVAEITPAVGVDASSKCAGVRGNPHQRGVGQYLLDEALQELLATAARCPVAVPDRAAGVPDPANAAVIRIPLVNTDGRYALIDAEDYQLVMRYSWQLDPSGRYAIASSRREKVRMHRLVMMVGSHLVVDHRARELTLDNRKANLRACTQTENMWNSKRSTQNSTGVKGVARKGNRFVATVKANKVLVKQSFDTLAEATVWVRQRRTELHGEFARHE